MTDIFIKLDKVLFLFLNRDVSNPLFDIFFPFITDKHNWIIPILILFALYIWKKGKKAGLVIGLAVITVAITDPFCVRILKPFFGRLRPCHPDYYIEGGRFLIGMKTSLAFPSAHAMNFFGQAMIFSLFNRKYWVWFFTAAFLVGYSRVYTGVHFPSDVAAGALCGMGVGWFVYYAYVVIRVNLEKRMKRRGKTKYLPE